MTGFIFAHVVTGEKVAIAIDHITVIAPTRDGRLLRIYTDDGDYTDVTESFDDVKESIEVMAR